MPHDQFIVPNNVNLSQALSLLHSIAEIQFENCKEQQKVLSKEDVIEILSSVLSYLREGLLKIKHKFEVSHFRDLKDPAAVIKYADVRILGEDIKEMLAEIRDKTPPPKQERLWKSKLKLKFNKQNEKLDLEKEAKEKEQVKQLRNERNKIIREEAELEAQRLKMRELEIEKQVRKDVKAELQKEKEKLLIGRPLREPVAGRRSMEQMSRRSFDGNGRRSLDGYGKRKSYQSDAHVNTPSSPSVNQAALLAWGGQVSPIPNSANSKAKQKPGYAYTKPTVRRPVITSPSPRTSPKIVTRPYFEKQKEMKPPVSLGVSKKNLTEKPSRASSVEKLSPFEIRLQDVMNNLEGVDENSCQQIVNDILITNEKVYWDDISGLASTKNALKETVVYPFLRPDLFQGLREPVAGILLFGPPGTGKTMIAKAVATESKSTFFSISASSVLSKFLGESEKLVRALFYLSKKLAPSIIFIDEIDSLLTARSDNENESSRRIKTEFLIRWSSLSGASTREGNSDHLENSRVLVLAATNTPWDLDEAARRRFSKRIYIALPDFETRVSHLKRIMSSQRNQLSESDYNEIATITEGFSGSDLTTLAKDAAMEPIRDLGEDLININLELVRAVGLQDFKSALTRIKKSVSSNTLVRFEEWATIFGSTGV